MKKHLPGLLTLCLLSCLSCKKSSSSSNSNNDNTQLASTTPPKPVSTRLAVYAYNNTQAGNPLQVYTYNDGIQASFDYQAAYDGFFAGPLTLDKYLARLAYQTTITAGNPGFWQFKALNLSSDVKNYVGFNLLNFTNTGNAKNLGGPTTLNLPGGGTLAFPPGAFSADLDMRYDIYVNYLDPTATGFSAGLPGLPFADQGGKRRFLESYGLYQIRPILTYCNCTILSSEDLFAKEVTMQMPIPPGRLAGAPDSIEAWHLNAHTMVWEQSGFAYKKNAVYEKNIRQYGVWNFATPRDAAYVTLQLRMANDAALPNTRFVVKDNGYETAEGRTDIAGNALVLVPVNKTLAFNIIDDHFLHYLNLQPADQTIGRFTGGDTKKVVLADRNDIGTLEGTVYKCDGSSFGNGLVVISQKGAKDDYEVPVTNGQFKTANWLNLSFGDCKLSFMDANGNKSFEVNTYLGSQYITHLKRLKENFYACANADSLYCHYQLGNVANSFYGSVKQTSPVLEAKVTPGTTVITISDGSKGISFSMWILGGPTGVISTGLPLLVNNTTCRYDPNGTQELTIYRSDAGTSGFMEGWFVIDYLDAGNTPQKASGNFRIKITN